MIDYRGKLVLAPMVRISELPTRLLSLKYGADLVWGPEIVDKKLIHCKRVWNDKIKCVDFVENSSEKLVFRTFPDAEKSKLVFQMGTASSELAVQAAKVVANDVSAIDVNSGCPKHFSIHSGMGAALLKTPDILESILRALVAEVGKPYKIDISVKIRILDDPGQTYALVRRLAQTGISLLTVHCRTTPMRPREPVIRDTLAGIADICRSHGVACYVNGDVGGRYDLQDLMHKYHVDGAMIARGAECNPSCFGADSPKSLVAWPALTKEYVDYCKRFDHAFAGTKYSLLRLVPGKDPVYQQLSRAKSFEEVDRVLEALTDTEPVQLASPPAEPQQPGDTTKTDSVVSSKRRRSDSPHSQPSKVRPVDSADIAVCAN